MYRTTTVLDTLDIGYLVSISKVRSTIAAAFHDDLAGGKVKSYEYCIDI